jgi:hypothetical protein
MLASGNAERNVMSWLVRSSVLLLVSALAPVARAGGVRIVEPTGTQNFATLGAAVSAAAEGDVLLVGAGSYSGFTVSGKSLWILAVPGADVVLGSPIVVSGLGANQSLLLSGLRVALPDDQDSAAALTIDHCDGPVRIERGSFKASDLLTWFCPTLQPGGPGVRVVSSPRVAFQACQLTGGRGEGLDPNEYPLCTPGADGGAGVEASSSTVVFYDCTATGGEGGGSEGTQGIGGAGLALTQSSALGSDSTFLGGRGGANYFQAQGTHGGMGGTSVSFAGSSTLYDVVCTFVPGPGGYGSGGTGPTGPLFVGGAPLALAGPARHAIVSPVVLADLSSWTIAYDGAPSEQALLLSSLEPAQVIAPAFHGAWLVRRAQLAAIQPLGLTSASGSLATALATGDLPAGSLLQKRCVQVAARNSGSAWLGSQASLLILDRDSGPDCNGNGVSDFVDILLGTAPDANHNLIPDTCPGG